MAIFTFVTEVKLNSENKTHAGLELGLLPLSVESALVTVCFPIVEQQTPAGIYRWYNDLTLVGAVVTDGMNVRQVSNNLAKKFFDDHIEDINEELEWVHEVKHVESNSTA